MSSRSITPARRTRDMSHDSDETPDGDGSSSSSTRSNKRARLDDVDDESEDNEDEDEEDVQFDEQPVLPDSYNRSPKGKQRAVNGMTGNPEPKAFQPGSIVRVALKNFVTYTEAEFHPGPNLNMVIGPNGTGKSTLVCAICLGLGWNTGHLGRAKDIGEFVKHGAGTASIEIELARDPARHRKNPVIECNITKEGNKTKFSIDGHRSNKKEVQELAQSFSIQVDNLCQFLPQDRVVEFAALSPVDLLAQTQRAAAPEQMTKWHDQLKDLRKNQKQQQTEQHTLSDQVKNLEDRQRSQEGDVARLRERGQLSERIAILEKLTPYPEYNKRKREHAEAQERRTAAREELKALEDRIGPNLAAVTQKENYIHQMDKILGQRERLLNKAERDSAGKLSKSAAMVDQIKAKTDEIESEKSGYRMAKQTIPRLQQDIDKIQQAIDTEPPDFNPSEMNERIRGKRSRIREIEAEVTDVEASTRTWITKGKDKENAIARIERQREGLQSQAGRQENKLGEHSKDAAIAWKWIQENRDKFSSPVYGPAMLECSVKNASNAGYVESALQASELLAFTVTSEADFKMLTTQLYTEMRLTEINVRSSTQPLSAYQPPLSKDQLRALKLDCWVLDFIEGPDAVLAMLCDNGRLHLTAFASVEPTDSGNEAIQKSGLNSWITPTVSNFIVRRREYGDSSSNIRIRKVKPAKLLTDTPVDHQLDRDLQRKISELEEEHSQCQDQVREEHGRMKGLNHEKTQLNQDISELLEEKNQKQRQLAEYNALPTKLEGAQRKLDDAKEQVTNSQKNVLQCEDDLDQLYLEKGQYAIDHAQSLVTFRTVHVQLFETQIMHVEATSDLEQLQARHQKDQALLERHQAEVEELTRVQQRAFQLGKAAAALCKDLAPTLTEAETEVVQEIRDWEPDRMETEMESVQAQLDMLHGGGNENLIREYELRGQKIEEKRSSLRELEASLEAMAAEISRVRERWEPQLDELVGKISDAFAENFAKISCVGEVGVHKDEDFDQWAIQIKVKFREHEQLSILDSHRQSGGERAVSTIFYLMALQSLARAPFRVVDEINQGMDPRNERLVHSRMVDIACQEHTCQYFLITPKLLNGLKYHPNMKVHCIASGEYMPDDHRELNFGALAKRALAVRAAVAAS